MNRIKLSEKWKKHCSNMPESGMGYQRVICDVKNSDNEEIKISAIVINGSILESVIPVKEENIINIILEK